MKISILIPTLNRRDLLRASLRSAQEQTHGDLEILVSDNGSTDGTPEFVRGVAAEDPRVRLVPRNPDPGLFQNVNHLLRQAAGEAFGMLSDDDLLQADYAARLVEILARHPEVGVVFCDHGIIDAIGQPRPAEAERNSRDYGRTGLPAGVLSHALVRVLRGVMSVNFSLYRRAVFAGEFFDLACGGAADLDFAIRAAQRTDIYYVPARLGDYRVHGTNTTAREPGYMIEGTIRALAKHRLADPDAEAERCALLRRQYLIHAYYSAGRNHQAGRQSLRQYRALGGASTSSKAMLAALLFPWPVAWAAAAKRLLVALRGRAQPAPPPGGSAR